MSVIGSISPAAITALPLKSLDGVQKPAIAAPMPDGMRQAPPSASFGSVLEGLVSTVAEKQAVSTDLTKQVLLGNHDQLHQSVIAMQEASVAFSLMVEVRNKLVESYQELMRMQV
ncbi:MAG: flagellar hook-basal body complex protein FliE [Verrucomicrobiota bacterium]|nr:flagellar hook-basal body complex protein FliE [Verrucomicrobiota bacterium]